MPTGSKFRLLYIQKPEILAQQRDVVQALIAERLPECTVEFASFGESATGSFDCVMIPASAEAMEVLQQVSSVSWIHFMGAGIDAVENSLGDYSEVLMSASPGVNADSIAEYVIGGILYFTKRFRKFTKQQQSRHWSRHWLEELNGKTLLCLGTGAVGKAVARRAKAFDMSMIGLTRTVRELDGFDQVGSIDEIFDYLPEADIVVCALPLTNKTHHLIGKESLAIMRRDAILVNVARGGIVDTHALIHALESSSIRGAILDVFEEEPLSQHSQLWSLDNVLITPHVAGTTNLYLERMLDIFIANYDSLVAGNGLTTPVRNLQ